MEKEWVNYQRGLFVHERKKEGSSVRLGAQHTHQRSDL